MRSLLLLVCLCAPLSAQLHFGLKGGVPVTDVTETIGNATVSMDKSSRWTLGPMVELDLPAGLGLEFNALYRKVGVEVRSPLLQSSKTAAMWDFPLIAKYHFPGVVMRPYIAGGVTFRNLPDILNPASSSSGFTLGSGLRFSIPFMRIAPEIRYTHWGTPDVQPAFRTKSNQFEVLVGLSF